MRVVFFGTPQFAVPTLEKLLEHPEFEVIGVVTQPDKRRGRGKQLIPSAIKKVAVKGEIPVWQPKGIKKAKKTLETLKNIQADVFVVVAYGQILSSEILTMPKLGCINVHGSLLPEYRGAAPIQWSLYHGDRQTGITTMLMDEGMDTGAMLLKADTEVSLFENADQLATKLADQGADLLIETLEKLILQEIEPIEQDEEKATYAPLIQKEDYLIDWTKSATAIHNQVRGFYPNCVTILRDNQLKVLATIPLDDTYLSELGTDYDRLIHQVKSLDISSGNPGEIVGLIKNFGPIIQTGEGYLLLQEIQPSGKRVQSGWDLVNGMRLTLGERLG